MRSGWPGVAVASAHVVQGNMRVDGENDAESVVYGLVSLHADRISVK